MLSDRSSAPTLSTEKPRTLPEKIQIINTERFLIFTPWQQPFVQSKHLYFTQECPTLCALAVMFTKTVWVSLAVVWFSALECSVVTILEFLTSIRYLEKYRYSIPFSIPGREKNCHNIKGVNNFFFFDKYNMTMRYILHEQKCLEVVHLFKV